MTTVEDIKKAAANLSPDEQAESFQWFESSDELRRLSYE